MINSKLISLPIITIFFIIQSWMNAACSPKISETNSANSVVKATQSNATDKTLSIAKNNSPLPSNKNLATPELICSPKQIRKGDTLTLKMKLPHGGYLEIITPKKRYLFLSELDGDKLVEDVMRAGATPFYPASECAKLTELKINTSEATTTDYNKGLINGKYPLSKIFIEPGKYKILLSLDSFEQDDPTIEGRCEILFDD